MKLIELREVDKSFRKSSILKNVNLAIEEGDILGVIGQSGGGKSTLLNLIAGFIEPTDGEVIFHSSVNGKEKDLNANLHGLKKYIGYTPQHNSFYPKLTVGENLWHFGRLYSIKKKMLQTNIQNLLNFTRLIDHKKKLGEELSGGMQKRLDISCSLVHKPKILILDEPTADLDPLLQKEILHMLQEVNKQGVTIVIASHQLESIEHICNKVAIVHDGKVHSQGLLNDVRKPLFRDHFTIRIQPGTNKEQLVTKLKTFPVKKIVDKGNNLIIYPDDVEKTISSLLTVIKEENLYLHDLDLRKPSLQEVFENVVTGKN